MNCRETWLSERMELGKRGEKVESREWTVDRVFSEASKDKLKDTRGSREKGEGRREIKRRGSEFKDKEQKIGEE